MVNAHNPRLHCEFSDTDQMPALTESPQWYHRVLYCFTCGKVSNMPITWRPMSSITGHCRLVYKGRNES